MNQQKILSQKSLSTKSSSVYNEMSQKAQNDYYTLRNEMKEYKKETVPDNTEIFRIKLKLNPYEYLTFSVGRFDNIYISFRDFCILHKIPLYLYKPLLRHIIIAMNKVFTVFNRELSQKDKITMDRIRSKYYQKNNHNSEELMKKNINSTSDFLL
ncbi:MAG: hypothetical protein MJ252_15460 [archaeon]|nr:hypothetical protein [archaeon]